MKKLVIIGMFLFVILVSCGSSKEEAEENMAEVFCNKIFTCEETAAYRPFLGGTEDGCIESMTTQQQGEDGEECENYSATKADQCISCYEGLSCTEFASMMNEESDPCPVCDEVCPD